MAYHRLEVVAVRFVGRSFVESDSTPDSGLLEIMESVANCTQPGGPRLCVWWDGRPASSWEAYDRLTATNPRAEGSIWSEAVLVPVPDM